MSSGQLRGARPSASPTRRHPPRDRVRYAFDRALSRGPSVVIGWLGLLTLAVIIVAAAVFALARLTGVNGDGRLGFGEALWQAMLRVVDAGTFAGDTTWSTRLLGLAVTLAGIFIAGSLIGLIANAVDQRIEMLRKGRSMVLEQDHTLILGWSDRVPAVVSELIIANESRRKAAVVVLADTDKTAMEETLRGAIEDWRTTRLVCRSGTTSAAADLAMVNAAGARSVIVMGGNDAAVVKTLLALRTDDRRTSKPPIVAEVNDDDTARSVRSLLGTNIVIVNSDAVVAELTAQACRQRGLSQVFRELLDFDGDEIYFDSFPTLTGRTYRDAQLAFETSTLMGISTAAGELALNPPPATVIAEGDRLVAIAVDDSMFTCADVAVPAGAALVPEASQEPDRQRRVVLVGWSSLGPRVVAELDDFLGAETTVEIIVDPSVFDVEAVENSVDAHHVRVEVVADSGRPEEVVRNAAHRAFDEVIVLGQRDGVSAEEADARTLLLLLAFNRLVVDDRLERVRIVAEMLQQHHAPLAQATGADDFIVSDELTSLMIAQLSENHHLDRVFRDLFDHASCTIEMMPTATYGASHATCFADVVVAASAQGHTALGYRLHDAGAVVLNPPKGAPLALTDADHLVVLR